jgi:hypothetical protein
VITKRYIKKASNKVWWLTMVIPAMQEAISRRIAVQDWLQARPYQKNKATEVWRHDLSHRAFV